MTIWDNLNRILVSLFGILAAWLLGAGIAAFFDGNDPVAYRYFAASSAIFIATMQWEMAFAREDREGQP